MSPMLVSGVEQKAIGRGTVLSPQATEEKAEAEAEGEADVGPLHVVVVVEGLVQSLDRAQDPVRGPQNARQESEAAGALLPGEERGRDRPGRGETGRAPGALVTRGQGVPTGRTRNIGQTRPLPRGRNAGPIRPEIRTMTRSRTRKL